MRSIQSTGRGLWRLVARRSLCSEAGGEKNDSWFIPYSFGFHNTRHQVPFTIDGRTVYEHKGDSVERLVNRLRRKWATKGPFSRFLMQRMLFRGLDIEESDLKDGAVLVLRNIVEKYNENEPSAFSGMHPTVMNSKLSHLFAKQQTIYRDIGCKPQVTLHGETEATLLHIDNLLTDENSQSAGPEANSWDEVNEQVEAFMRGSKLMCIQVHVLVTTTESWEFAEEGGELERHRIQDCKMRRESRDHVIMLEARLTVSDMAEASARVFPFPWAMQQNKDDREDKEVQWSIQDWNAACLHH